MLSPEEELIHILKDAGIDFTASLPCEKIKVLLEMAQDQFFHVPLTREEEGVGICAGAALAGKRPAIFVQSSGIGNMINALLSLTGFYELPLAIFVSQRGIYKEKIAAQLPMGQKLFKILRGSDIRYTAISSRSEFDNINRTLKTLFNKNRIHAFLLSPEIWEESSAKSRASFDQRPVSCIIPNKQKKISVPEFTRYEILDIIAEFLTDKVVACNLGWPAKELYALQHQPSNFYMLGSMGMISPIGLGISLSSKKEVVVIDGDGSLLMNPGVLATAAHFGPDNLTILAIDNSSYGSTGSQKTLTASCVDLELVAKGFGIRNAVKVSTKKEILTELKKEGKGLRFIHILAVPGNKELPNIPIHHLETKKEVMNFIKKRLD